jgi:EmrB/QacA subfamily drug resistance transporter
MTDSKSAETGSSGGGDATGAAPQPARADTRQMIALAVISTAYLMLAIDSTIVNIALTKIQESLHFSATGLAWVLNSYLLAFGGLLLLGGRAGDMFGRRRVVSVGITLFTCASVAGGLAANPATLIVARALQGVGAALAAPNTLALIANNFDEGEVRNKALRIFSAASATGGSIGLILGGMLTSWASWRWIQFVNIPIGIVVLILAPLCIRETERHQGSFDIVGTITGTAGVVALVYALIRAPVNGWGDPGTVACFVIAAIMFPVFLAVERRVSHPIVPLQLFASRNRSVAYMNMLLFTATILSMFYFISQFIQKVLGFSPVNAGLAFLPMTIGMFAVARVVPSLLARFGLKGFMLTGSLLMTITAIWLSRVSPSDSYLSGIFGPMLLFGIGAGCCIMPTNVTILAGIPPQLAGAASGVLQSVMQLGGALGLAILVAVYGTATAHFTGTGTNALKQVVTHGVRETFTTTIVFSGLAFLLALIVIKTVKPAAAAKAPALVKGSR